jgi:hypothetical protein
MSEPTATTAASEETIREQTIAAFKAEVSSYLAKTMIAAIAGIIGLAALGLWIYVKTLLPDLVGGVPPGAIMAFDLPGGCPAGWSRFDRGTSRFIVGATEANFSEVRNADKNNQRLSAHSYGFTGGEEQHALTIDEMPAHDHGLNTAQSTEFLRENGNHFQGTISVGRDAQRTDPKQPIKFTEIVGGGKAFNLMPPFLALPFCKKG